MINQHLLNPKSIVVVGGSDDVQKPGGKVLKNLIDHHFNVVTLVPVYFVTMCQLSNYAVHTCMQKPSSSDLLKKFTDSVSGKITFRFFLQRCQLGFLSLLVKNLLPGIYFVLLNKSIIQKIQKQ